VSVQKVLKLSVVHLPLLLVLTTSCVKVQPPTDTGNSLFAGPSAPSGPSASGPLAYEPDLKPLFASDCVLCHSPSRADGDYRMDTYAQVMREVRVGDEASALVMSTQPGHKMYPYWSGNDATRRAKAALMRSWVVTYRALEKR